MRKLVAVLSVVLIASMVAAQAESQSNLPEPGTTPASPFFGLEQAQESISMALTFDKEKKAQKRLKIAQERLAEAKKLSDNNDTENAEKAVGLHNQALEKANRSIQELPADRRSGVEEEMNRTLGESVRVLEDLKQKLPESAMEGINTAIRAHKQRGLGQEGKPDSPNPGNQTGVEPGQDRPEQDGGNTSGREDISMDNDTEYRGTGKIVRNSSE